MTREPSSRLRAALAHVALVGSLLIGCGGDGVIRKVGDLPPPPPGAGFVEIACDPPTADLYVDGVYRGRLDGYRNGVIRMPEGARRITLRKVGHYPFHGTIAVGQATTRVETRLVPEVP